MGRRTKRVKVDHSSSRLAEMSQLSAVSEGAPSIQPFPSDFPTEVWLEVHLRFSPVFSLSLNAVTGIGEGRIMGPLLALLDIKNPASITQAANVYQSLGRRPATPSQYRTTSSNGVEGSGFGFTSPTPILSSTTYSSLSGPWLIRKG